ncbi:MAG: hypothetical protein ACE5HI_14780 [bacterium]
MKIKLAIAFFAVLFGVSTSVVPVLACSNLGPGKHLGIVRMVDATQGTLTLIDAETRKAIHFLIAEDLLKKVQRNDRVIITFKSEKDQLIVEDIAIQPV